MLAAGNSEAKSQKDSQGQKLQTTGKKGMNLRVGLNFWTPVSSCQ
jgi:hypothetical protein